MRDADVHDVDDVVRAIPAIALTGVKDTIDRVGRLALDCEARDIVRLHIDDAFRAALTDGTAHGVDRGAEGYEPSRFQHAAIQLAVGFWARLAEMPTAPNPDKWPTSVPDVVQHMAGAAITVNANEVRARLANPERWFAAKFNVVTLPNDRYEIVRR